MSAVVGGAMSCERSLGGPQFGTDALYDLVHPQERSPRTRQEKRSEAWSDNDEVLGLPAGPLNERKCAAVCEGEAFGVGCAGRPGPGKGGSQLFTPVKGRDTLRLLRYASEKEMCAGSHREQLPRRLVVYGRHYVCVRYSIR